MTTFRNTKKIISTVLITGFVLVFVLLLIQTSSGKYANLWYLPWLWFLCIYVPPIIYLLSLKEEEKSLRNNALLIISLLFVLSSIITILMQQYVYQQSTNIPVFKSYSATLGKSLIFLLPLMVIILYFIWRAKKDILPIIPSPKVFISYNHQDSVTALKIRDSIEAADIPVIIDQVNMKVGTSINDFIEKSIKEATVIVSVVSNKSLNSAWVAKETMDTIFLQTYFDDKKFMACYLDDDFLDNSFTLRSIEKIDNNINEIEQLMDKSREKGIDTRDLNDQKSRLIALRNGLDGIIGRMRNSLVLDIRDEQFDSSMEQLILAISE